MNKLLQIILPGLLVIFNQSIVLAQSDAVPKKFSEQKMAMGSAFSISVISNNEKEAQSAIAAGYQEIDRIERLISSWDATSQTARINQHAGSEPVKVDNELYGLIYRCKKISEFTGGTFDISFASIEPIWKFDGSMTAVPDSFEIQKSIAFINYKNIVLNRSDTSVFLKDKGMKIGFGAIGKGYAANRARFVIQQLGVKNGLVNAGGDLVAWGQDEYYRDWRVAIADPNNEENILAWLSASNTSVVTSGDYEKYVELDGTRYSHIINPLTGYPATGIKSVTVVWFDAELADALATAVFVLGKENGLDLIDSMPGIECLIITDENELISSKNLSITND